MVLGPLRAVVMGNNFGLEISGMAHNVPPGGGAAQRRLVGADAHPLGWGASIASGYTPSALAGVMPDTQGDESAIQKGRTTAELMPISNKCFIMF